MTQSHQSNNSNTDRFPLLYATKAPSSSISPCIPSPSSSTPSSNHNNTLSNSTSTTCNHHYNNDSHEYHQQHKSYLYFRPLQSNDREYIKELHDEWFPVKYTDDFFNAVVKNETIVSEPLFTSVAVMTTSSSDTSTTQYQPQQYAYDGYSENDAMVNQNSNFYNYYKQQDNHNQENYQQDEEMLKNSGNRFQNNFYKNSLVKPWRRLASFVEASSSMENVIDKFASTKLDLDSSDDMKTFHSNSNLSSSSLSSLVSPLMMTSSYIPSAISLSNSSSTISTKSKTTSPNLNWSNTIQQTNNNNNNHYNNNYNLSNNTNTIVGCIVGTFLDISKRKQLQHNQTISSLIRNPSKHYRMFYIMTLGTTIRKKGLGAKLVQDCIEMAESVPTCGVIYLHVIIHNLDAIRFYEKLGFLRMEEIEDYYSIDNQTYNCYLYAKFINGNRRSFTNFCYSFCSNLFSQFLPTSLSSSSLKSR